MDRYKKEMKKKYDAARRGLTTSEVSELNEKEANARQRTELVRKLHCHMFPEEYDSMYDSRWDAHERKKGVNPMVELYSTEVNDRRRSLGVSFLKANGTESGDSGSWGICYGLIRAAEMKRKQLPKLSKRYLNCILVHVFEKFGVPQQIKDKDLPANDNEQETLGILQEMQVENYERRLDTVSEISEDMYKVFDFQNNTEGTPIFLSMALAIKELYLLSNEQLILVMSKSRLAKKQ